MQLRSAVSLYIWLHTRLYCLYSGRPRPWVKWYRDEAEVDTAAAALQASSVRGVIHVGPLTRADVRATLTCRASNHLRAHPIETTLTLDMNCTLIGDSLDLFFHNLISSVLNSRYDFILIKLDEKETYNQHYI